MGIFSHLFLQTLFTWEDKKKIHTYFTLIFTWLTTKNSHAIFHIHFSHGLHHKNSHSIFHMDFSHNRKTLFSHYFFTCSFESLLISHTKKEVHMYVKLQFCVWNLFHSQNFTCLIYFTCISHAFHIYFTRLLLVVRLNLCPSFFVKSLTVFYDSSV